MFNHKEILLIISLVLALFSCKPEVEEIVEESKYREKNLTSRLYISSVIGDIHVQGWSNDFIEIRSVKRIRGGLKPDINYLDLEFERMGESLNIITRNPSLVEGRIDLTIFVPYNLKMIIIKAEKGRVSVTRYLWDLSVELNEGDFDCEFIGTLLRFKGGDVDSDIYLKTRGVADVVHSNHQGVTNLIMEAASAGSYIDLYSNRGAISLNIISRLNYQLFTNYTSPEVNLNGPVDKIYSDGKRGQVLQTGGVGDKSCKIFIKNERGTISIQEL